MSSGELPEMAPMPPPPARGRRSSLFEVSKRMAPCGSSVLSYSLGPTIDEDIPVIKTPKVQYENTYRMEPEKKFESWKVNAIMKEVLEHHLGDTTYDPTGCSIMAKLITQEITSKVRDLDYPRYKIICMVTIGEKNDQGVRVGSRCVWDVDRDSYATVPFESPQIFATATTYAVYYE